MCKSTAKLNNKIKFKQEIFDTFETMPFIFYVFLLIYLYYFEIGFFSLKINKYN